MWHCQAHGEEFETQPSYVEHLKVSHPEVTPVYFSPELIAAVVGPSLKPRRDCPFCPTAFSETIEMQKHIIFHLERFALLALPPLIGDGSDEEDSSGRPSDSHEVQHHGRQSSVLGDFDDADERSFADICYRANTQGYGHDQSLTKKSLHQIPTFNSDVSSSSMIWAWLECFAGDPLAGEASVEWPSEYNQVPRPLWQDIADEAFLDKIHVDVPPDTAADYLRIYQEAGGNQNKILQIIRDEGLEDRMRYWIPVTQRLSAASDGGPASSISPHDKAPPPLESSTANVYTPWPKPPNESSFRGLRGAYPLTRARNEPSGSSSPYNTTPLPSLFPEPYIGPPAPVYHMSGLLRDDHRLTRTRNNPSSSNSPGPDIHVSKPQSPTEPSSRSLRGDSPLARTRDDPSSSTTPRDIAPPLPKTDAYNSKLGSLAPLRVDGFGRTLT